MFILLSKEIASILLSIPESPVMLTAVELQLANEIVKGLCPFQAATWEVWPKTCKNKQCNPFDQLYDLLKKICFK